MKGLLLLVVLAGVAHGLACPKESFWRAGKCYGSTVGAPENDRDRPRTGFLHQPISVVDTKCCRCPRGARLDSSGDCSVRSGWLRRRIVLPDGCCHIGKVRGPRRLRADPVREDWNAQGLTRWNAPPRRPRHRQGGEESQDFGSFRTRDLMSADCDALGGTCMDSRQCTGTSRRHLGCPGGSSIQCCVPASSSSPSSSSSSSSSASWNSRWFNRNQGSGETQAVDLNPALPPPRAPDTSVEVDPHSGKGLAAHPGLCPNFYKVWNGYPPEDVDSVDLLQTIGMPWITNTCTVRWTFAMRALGISPGDIGHTKWVGKGKRYFIRVAEAVPFMNALFGPAKYHGHSVATTRPNPMGMNGVDWDPPVEIRGHAGIINFGDCIFSDATGHMDVWDGFNIREHDYFHRCRSAQVWEVCSPNPQPDYSALIAYLRKTGATN